MNTKHTPGPWEINESQRGTFIYQDRTENCIAEVYADVNEDQQANARLIAAAPEFLEALNDIANGDAMKGRSSWKTADIVLAYQRIARAAIAKATKG